MSTECASKLDEVWTTPSQTQVRERFNDSDMPEHLVEKSRHIVFKYERLNQPEMFYVFLEHLYHLGLVEYTNDPVNNGEYKGVTHWPVFKPKLIFIKLSHFGRLFHRACVAC